MSAILLLSALLAACLATAVAVIISFGNAAVDSLLHLTRRRGLGVIHDDSPAKYTLAYLLYALALGLFVAGIYHIGS